MVQPTKGRVVLASCMGLRAFRCERFALVGTWRSERLAPPFLPLT